MKARLALIWAAIMAAGVTVVGMLTGRRRKARARRQMARDQRRAKKAQRKAQGGGRQPSRTPAPSGAAAAATATEAATSAAPPTSPQAGPTSQETAAPAPAPAPEGDDLRAIKGLGAVAAEKLRGAGITTYAQIASWTPEEARDLALRLELQPGRIASDDWIGQARTLIDERAADPDSR